MHTLDLFRSYLAVAPADTPTPAGQHLLVVLCAAGILVFAILFMWRAVGPVLEIIKAALYAVSTFFLIAIAMVLLLVSAFR